jgi:hypothetical protein
LLSWYSPQAPDYAKYRIKLNDEQQEVINEIQEFWDARYLSSGEAAWRIMGFKITRKEPAVTAIPVHLPGSQTNHQYHRNNSEHSSLSNLN